jgi:hypothetical protein
LLYKKTEISQLNPEFERIQFEVKEDAILGVMLQYSQKGNTPLLRLHDTFAFNEMEKPLSSTQ